MRAPWRAVAATLFGVGWGANQFSSLLLVYRHAGLSASTVNALFGVYALGLVPGLLVGGPLSDARGRRLMLPVAAVSVLATVVLMLGPLGAGWLYAGRLLAGLVSGATFSIGTVWVKELSAPPFDPSGVEHTGARRAAVALSAGFGLGPVVAGLLAQWAPDPRVTPYLGHLAVMAVALPALWRAPETVRAEPGAARRSAARAVLAGLSAPALRTRRFLGVVAPMAPWVFGAPAVAFAVQPALVSARLGRYAVAFAALLTGLTLGSGILVQPLARSLDRTGGNRAARAGLLAITAGLLVAAAATAARSPALVVLAGVVLGCGYGLCLVAGLLDVQRLAPARDLAAATAVFYVLTYVGFATPLILTTLSGLGPPPVLLLGMAVLALVTLLGIVTQQRRSGLPSRGAGALPAPRP